MYIGAVRKTSRAKISEECGGGKRENAFFRYSLDTTPPPSTSLIIIIIIVIISFCFRASSQLNKRLG